MTSTSTIEQPPPAAQSRWWFWLVFLAGPILWLVQFISVYMLVEWACRNGAHWALIVINLFFLLPVAAAGLLAARKWIELGREVPSDTGPPEIIWAQFLAVLAMASAALFFLAISAQAIPTIIFSPCVH